MTDDRKSGIALIAGSVGGLLTMAMHPTTSAAITPAQLDRLSALSAIAHSLAMFSFLAMFLGALGLTARLTSAECRSSRDTDRLALAAIVVYAFSIVALLLATSVSGFILPAMMRHMLHDGAAYGATWRIVVDAVFQFNQTFARIYSVAACVSIFLWSVSILRNGSLGRGLALYGSIVTPLLIVLLAVGHIRLDVHGMAAIVVAHAIWFTLAGAQLWKSSAQPPAVNLS